jgi:UDP-N-acetylmuramyl pentapeptide phosphotransferase/UDP-N-acetylglucosamine-1-phosphate transferase
LLITGLAVAAGAFGLSALYVAGFRRWAAERMLDIPNTRSSHTRPTPRGGGLGIVMGVLIGIGFLFYNWPSARVFMGDVGSAFIGFTLAVLLVVAGRDNSRFVLAELLVV